MIAVFGGGDIAVNGIAPLFNCKITSVDVTSYRYVLTEMERIAPTTVIVTAGVSHPCDVDESDPARWAHEIEVNLIGSYHVAKAALMCDVSTLIFVASVAGLCGKPNHSGYSASKAGVISLVRSLAFEGHNAYAISPGRVDTKMRERDYPDEDPRTRLAPTQVGSVVRGILDGNYRTGDNIIVRKIGYDTFHRVDRGEPWKSWLKVGQPVTI